MATGRDNGGQENNIIQGIRYRYSMIINGFHSDRDFSLFLIAGIFVGIAGGINSTVFNNFLSDVYKLSAEARGIVEVPRELPGALIMLVLGLISSMGSVRSASLGMVFASIGMAGLGLLSPTFALMLVWMMTLSLGTHIFMPLSASIGMELSSKEQYGVRLGRFSAYNLAATIIGYAAVWAGFKYLSMSYQTAFIIAAVSYFTAALFLGIMSPQKPETKKVRFVFRKKYLLYYILCIVNGARKQIFLTFAPWVLIKEFHLGPPVFAVLGLAISLISIMTRTIVGNAIDIKGEKFVLSLEAVLLILICLGYAFSADFLPASAAVVVIAGCYVIDNSVSVVEMARSTYVKKIAVAPEDVTPTLSVGISVDHVVSMSIPFLGGLLWAYAGYKYVFLAATAVAISNLFLSMKIKVSH